MGDVGAKIANLKGRQLCEACFVPLGFGKIAEKIGQVAKIGVECMRRITPFVTEPVLPFADCVQRIGSGGVFDFLLHVCSIRQ